MAAPVGAVVTIAPYDYLGEGPGPERGDCLLSQGGSAYFILTARRMTRSARPNRYTLTCMKLRTEKAIPLGHRTLSLVWSRRDRRKR